MRSDFDRIINEKITAAPTEFFIIGLPADLHDSFISVSYQTFCAVGFDRIRIDSDGRQYFEHHDYMDDVNKYLSKEFASTVIPGYNDSMKITLAYAVTAVPKCGFGYDKASKFNDKLREKLSGMTKYEFYNSKR